MFTKPNEKGYQISSKGPFQRRGKKTNYGKNSSKIYEQKENQSNLKCHLSDREINNKTEEVQLDIKWRTNLKNQD